MTWTMQQEGAITDVRAWMKQSGGPQVFRVFGYAGTGKTTIAKDLATSVKKRVLFGAFTGKAALVLRRKGCEGARTIHSMIYDVDDKNESWQPKFVLNPGSDVADAGLVIIDECFVAGTLVDTPFGQRKIEDVKPGDMIENASGVDFVRAVAKKQEKTIVQIRCGGKTISVSENHPFFAKRGLVLARNLRPDDELIKTGASVRLLQDAVQAKDEASCAILFPQLQHELAASVSRTQGKALQSGTCDQEWGGAQGISRVGVGGGKEANREDSRSETVVVRERARQDTSVSDRKRLLSKGEGRQRTSDAVASATSIRETRDGMANGATDRRWSGTRDGSEELQDRYRQPVDDDCDRGRWGIARDAHAATCGSSEGCVAAFERVESVEVLEQGDSRLDQFRDASGKLYLYDLEATWHHSFSVEGLLVHNCSMVDEQLAKDLLSFGTKVLVLGDPAQLPPVKGAGYFTDAKPDVMLTEVHRQARDSPIIAMSMTIREGGKLEVGDYGSSRVIPKSVIDAEAILKTDQVIVGLNRTRQTYNRHIRTLLGREGDKPLKDDKLVCLKNNRDKKLLNGGLWTVQKVLKPKEAIQRLQIIPEDAQDEPKPTAVSVREEFFLGTDDQVPWEERKGTQEFTYGYALTCHKSQGSQWNDIVVFNESGAFRDDARRWLYTAVTRAAERVTIVQ